MKLLAFVQKDLTQSFRSLFAFAFMFLVPILIWSARDAPFGHDTVEAALMTNPVGAALNVINAPGFESYDLLPASWWIAAVVSTFMFAVLGVQVWRLSRAV